MRKLSVVKALLVYLSIQGLRVFFETENGGVVLAAIVVFEPFEIRLQGLMLVIQGLYDLFLRVYKLLELLLPCLVLFEAQRFLAISVNKLVLLELLRFQALLEFVHLVFFVLQ